MAKTSVAELRKWLTPDPWRREVGFSADLEDAQSKMLAASTDEEVAGILNGWLQRSQPCLFGRIAAKANQLSYCILRDADLERDDAFIQEKIQKCRTAWTREAFKGERSGFLIVAVSESLTVATPDRCVAALAHRLAELYLLDEVAFDTVHLEEVFLERSGREPVTWRWDAGINYFAAHGDKRWWHDHRIPGGVGFSINSVGHMAKSGLMRLALMQLDETLGTKEEDEKRSKVESLVKALELAMTTIDRAQDTVSGKATFLLSLPADQSTLAQRPSLPDTLDGRNHCEYFGYYHTDYTLPHEYFVPDVERPAAIKGYPLDFTYLFDKSADNPAYITVAEGRRVRKWDESTEGEVISPRLSKAVPVSIPIADCPRLKAILD